MKSVLIASIGLAALFILAPGAKAEQHQISVRLVQTVKPDIQTHPGVMPDIIGIRIGMTVSQAEAIAAKTYSSKLYETKDSLSVNYGGVFAQSQDFISRVVFQNGADDVLTMDFGNPATGNVVNTIERKIKFPDASRQPVLTAARAGLIKKYGPASSQQAFLYSWKFGDQLLDVWTHPATDNNNSPMGPTKVGSIDATLRDYNLQFGSETAGQQQLIAAVKAEQSHQRTTSLQHKH